MNKKIEDFKKAFRGMDLGHNMTWTKEGQFFFNWEDSLLPEEYYIVVYLKHDNWMLVTYSFPNGDGGSEEFEPNAYNKVKDFVLNFMDATEKEND